jgi:hypothetical protein
MFQSHFDPTEVPHNTHKPRKQNRKQLGRKQNRTKLKEEEKGEKKMRKRERTLPNKWRSKSSLMVSLLHTKMKPPRGSIRATAAADSLLSLAIPLPPPAAAAPPLCFGFN